MLYLKLFHEINSIRYRLVFRSIFRGLFIFFNKKIFQDTLIDLEKFKVHWSKVAAPIRRPPL